MKYIYICLILLFSHSALYADTKVSSGEVQKMLEQMVKQGSISEEQANAAKIRLGKMEDNEFDGLVNQASEVMKKNGGKMPSRSIASE